jgi:hypothetical protein
LDGHALAPVRLLDALAGRISESGSAKRPASLDTNFSSTKRIRDSDNHSKGETK